MKDVCTASPRLRGRVPCWALPLLLSRRGVDRAASARSALFWGSRWPTQAGPVLSRPGGAFSSRCFACPEPRWALGSVLPAAFSFITSSAQSQCSRLVWFLLRNCLFVFLRLCLSIAACAYTQAVCADVPAYCAGLTGNSCCLLILEIKQFVTGVFLSYSVTCSWRDPLLSSSALLLVFLFIICFFDHRVWANFNWGKCFWLLFAYILLFLTYVSYS